MRCNPWRWLWGLIPVAMLSWITFNWERPDIEADLTRRTQEALGREGLSWAVPEFSGRDAVLRGRASDEQEPKRAVEIVKRTWGVNTVDQRTDLIPKAEVYKWLAASDAKGKLVLSGHVPSEEARKTVLSVAKENFPKAAIEDAMQLARGAPPSEIWLDGANFGLRQLAQLKRGTVDLNGTTISVAGEAIDSSAFKSVKTALAKLPNGIKAGSDNVMPATASPFEWSAELAGEKLVLSGHVPSEAAREEIFALARQRFANITVVDRMEMAGGAPDGWRGAVSGALNQLSQLTVGRIDTSDLALVLKGEAADATIGEAVRKALRTTLPGTFKVTEEITWPVPQGPTPEELEAERLRLEAEARAKSEAEERARAEAEARAKVEADEQQARARAEADERLRLEAEARDRADAEQRARAEADEAARRKAEDERYAQLKAERERQWAELEARWSADAEARQRAAEEDARRRADEDAAALRRAEEEAARQRAEALRRKEEEQRLALIAAEQAARRAEADRCQGMMQEAISNGSIQFRTDSATIDRRSNATLDKLVELTGACPTSRIEISGHTDADGDDSYNLELSRRRAEAIVEYLAKGGVDPSRLSAVGYGETRPVADNDSASGKARNRRIEFKVIPN